MQVQSAAAAEQQQKRKKKDSRGFETARTTRGEVIDSVPNLLYSTLPVVWALHQDEFPKRAYAHVRTQSSHTHATQTEAV